MRGQNIVIDQLETYFKVEMAVPNTQLKKDENELKAPEKKEAEIFEAPKKKQGRWAYLKSWLPTTSSKPVVQAQEEEEEEDAEVLATRFVTFHEGSCMVLHYLPQKPLRQYGPFKAPQVEGSKPLPIVQWDSQVVWTRRINNLREVKLLNYRMVSEMDDPDDSLIEVKMTFSDIAFQVVPITEHDPNANKPYQSPFIKQEEINFLIEYEDVEELFTELRLQFYLVHLNNCSLAIM